MKRTVECGAMFKNHNVQKNLAKFVEKVPAATPFCEFNDDCTIDEIVKALPITDKFLADGTVNHDWTYYFDIDADEDGMYVWFIERD